MGQAAVWATQMLWPIIPGAVKTVLLVLVSSLNAISCKCVIRIYFLLQYAVVGFLNASFSGFEQGSGHSVPVGYLKGGTVAGQNLVFDVRSTPGTASEL